MNQARLIARLRQAFNLSESEMSDEDLLESSKGTITRSVVEFGIAMEDFKQVMADAMPRSIRRHFRR
jgi:hypothetical protein